jgi:hypothetical protein
VALACKLVLVLECRSDRVRARFTEYEFTEYEFTEYEFTEYEFTEYEYEFDALDTGDEREVSNCSLL